MPSLTFAAPLAAVRAVARRRVVSAHAHLGSLSELRAVAFDRLPQTDAVQDAIGVADWKRCGIQVREAKKLRELAVFAEARHDVATALGAADDAVRERRLSPDAARAIDRLRNHAVELGDAEIRLERSGESDPWICKAASDAARDVRAALAGVSHAADPADEEALLASPSPPLPQLGYPDVLAERARRFVAAQQLLLRRGRERGSFAVEPFERLHAEQTTTRAALARDVLEHAHVRTLLETLVDSGADAAACTEIAHLEARFASALIERHARATPSPEALADAAEADSAR